LTSTFNILDAGKTLIPSININNVSVNVDITLNLRDKAQTVVSLTPNSASPVLKT